MYDKFCQSSGIPFLLTPDSRFFFGSSGHGRALAHLVHGLSQEEGFIVIIGEVGAGLRELAPTSTIQAASGDEALLNRMEALEQNAARQERVFRRRLDLLGAEAEISL